MTYTTCLYRKETVDRLVGPAVHTSSKVLQPVEVTAGLLQLIAYISGWVNFEDTFIHNYTHIRDVAKNAINVLSIVR